MPLTAEAVQGLLLSGSGGRRGGHSAIMSEISSLTDAQEYTGGVSGRMSVWLSNRLGGRGKEDEEEDDVEEEEEEEEEEEDGFVMDRSHSDEQSSGERVVELEGEAGGRRRRRRRGA